MVETEMKTKSLVKKLVPGRRESQPAIIDVDGMILFSCNSEMQGRVWKWLHFEIHFATPRARRNRTAKGIKESGRGVQVAPVDEGVSVRHWLCQRNLISVAIMGSRLIRSEEISTTENFALTVRPSHLQSPAKRQLLFCIDSAKHEVSIVRLRLYDRGQTKFQPY